MDAVTPLVLAGSALFDAPRHELGGKGANLVLLSRLGLPVPTFFVIAPAANAAFLANPALRELHRRALGYDSPGERAALRAAIARAPLPEGLVVALRAARAELGDGDVAVRSSALGEDAAGASFAGQFDSVLHVDGEAALLDAVRTCWASAFSDRAATYRAHRGIGAGALRMAIVVQTMVAGEVSGVLFTRDPARSEAEDVLVSAAFGLGEGVVSGRADTDTYRVARDGEVTAEVGDKRRMVVAAPGGGTAEVPVPEELRGARCLTLGEARALATYGRRLEEHLGTPQDVEWTLVAGRTVLLQTRPLTGVGARLGRPHTWDNANIIESYGGVTAPLTYTFARAAYEVVYRQFCDVMGVPPETVNAHGAIFRSMIGRIRGRIYYRLDSWYQVLAMLPGFEYNKRFMEQMMGVRERADLGKKEPTHGLAARLLYGGPAMARLFGRTLGALAGLDERIRTFHAEFEAAYADHGAKDFTALPVEAVLDLYRELEQRLLWNWKAPIVNDFYAMVFFGVLKKLVATHGLDDTGTLQNDLLCGEGGMASTEPAREVVRIARTVEADPALAAAFGQHDDRALVAALGFGGALPEPELLALRERLDVYLAVYGDRCMNELKLEEPTLHDDPSFLVAMIRNYLGRPEISPESMEAKERAVRERAEAVVRERLPRRHRPLFDWVLGRARRHIRDRENMRLVRTRVFGLVRRLFRAFGDHMARRGVLDRRDDVFWLTLDEVFGWVEGTGATVDLRALVTLRRAEHAAFLAEPPPDDRFVTAGPVAFGNLYRSTIPRTVPQGAVLTGIGCAPGVVRGRARIVRAPTDDLRLDGDILVAERTDPGWVPLYPSASGILVERGSALSHSAIVAREFGIPTIVGIQGLLARVRDGQWVELDGAAGTVRLDVDAV